MLVCMHNAGGNNERKFNGSNAHVSTLNLISHTYTK